MDISVNRQELEFILTWRTRQSPQPLKALDTVSLIRMKDNATTNRPTFNETPILLGFALQREDAKGRIQITLRWGRILTTLLAFSIAIWICAAATLYSYFKHKKDFEAVRFAGMLTLPFRMDDHRIEMGDYHIGKGLAEIKHGNYRDALRLLRLGVTRSPGNLEGRRVLAEFYELAFKRDDIAAELMLIGLDNGGIENPDYLKQTLKLLLRHQMDDKVQEVADKYLPEKAELTTRNRTLAFAAANANYQRGNYDQAEDYLVTYDLLKSLEGLMLSTQIYWDRGEQIAAITLMEKSLPKFPDAEPLMMQLSRYHREMGNMDQARRYAILCNVKAPLSLTPRLELLYMYNKAGDLKREQGETQRMLKLFRDDANALQALSNFAANTGNIELARRTYEEALEHEFSIDAFALLLIEAHLAHKDHQGALDFSEELLTERPDWLTQRWAIFNSLRAVAAYCTERSDLGEIYLQNFIEEPKSLPQTYLNVARRLNNNDCNQQARKVLTTAHQRKPHNQKILSELIRVNLKLGNTEDLNSLLPRLLQMRRPQIKLLVEAYNKLGSDRFIFTPDRESLLLQLSAIIRASAQSLPTVDS